MSTPHMSTRQQKPDTGPPGTPEAIHAILESAFNHGDLDALVSAYDDDAAFVMPADGRIVHGRDEIRAASAPVFDLASPRMSSVLTRLVRTDDLARARARARWEFSATAPDRRAVYLSGQTNLVSRRCPDGTWGIVLDDPMSRA